MTRAPEARSPQASTPGFEYAWWLTGDPEAAAEAVRCAGEDPRVRNARGPVGVETLLSSVRAAAVRSATMCPASEVALLHDRLGVALDAAASLVGVDDREALTELAHGRLEALPDTPGFPLRHPERLGGLAVANPDDVAHARQCENCGAVRQLLARGRQEIRLLPVCPAPPGLQAPPEIAETADPRDRRAASHPSPPATRRGLVVAAALTLAVLGGALVTTSPLLVVSAAVAVAGLVVAVALHPPLAVYVLLAATPLVVGMDRGAVLPLLRPNEALIGLLAAGLLLGGTVRVLAGRWPRLRITSLDAALLALLLTGSVLPVLWLVARGEPLTQDDLLYALTLWKYYGVFLLVRASVHTERHVRTCLALSMAAATVVAILGILQALQLFNVPELLASLYAPFDDAAHLQINRATSTIAQEHAVADFLTFNLAIALGWLILLREHRVPVAGAALLFAVGGLASGTFSGMVAMVIGLVAVGIVTGHLRHALAGLVSAVLVGAVVLQPVLQRRLANTTDEGLPSSWVGRWENLTEHVWPQVFSGLNVVFGVRPAARLPAPESWRPYIFIESGHTWLLWTGGIPLLLAFFAFLWIAIRAVWRVARDRTDAVGVAGVASFAALCVVGVLMTLDPHLTLRGSADLLFPLLALATALPRPPPADVSAADHPERETGSTASGFGRRGTARPMPV